MNITHTKTVSTPLGVLQDAGKVYTGAACAAADESYAAGGGGTSINILIPSSGLKAIVLLATTDCTVTPSGGAAITLVANVERVVTSASAASSVTVESDDAGTIKIRVLYDPTP